MGGSEAKTTIVASTPVGHGFVESAPPHTPCLKKRKNMSEPEFSGISDQEPLLVDSEMSGVDDVEMPKSSADKTSAADKSSSFINPFEISIDTSGNFDTKDDSLDEDYEPSFFFTIRWRRIFNKKSFRWSAQPVKEKKTFLHIPHLLRKITTLRPEDRVGMNRKALLEPDDHRRLSKNLAAIPPPPTQEIVQQQRSRFGVDFDKTIDYTYE